MVQNSFSKYQGQGYAGQLARPNEAYILDRGQAGEALRPGDGVRFDGAQWVKPTDAAEQLDVTAIVNYDVSVISTDGDIAYASGDSLKLARGGTFFLVAGEAIAVDDVLVYDFSAEDWIKAPAATANDLTSQPKMIVTAVTGGADGELIEARIHGLIRA